jgi:hypothetical protein
MLDPAKNWRKLVASTLIRDGMALFFEPTNNELMVARAQEHELYSLTFSQYVAF